LNYKKINKEDIIWKNITNITNITTMVYIAFTNQFDRIFGIFDIHFNDIRQISQEKLSQLFDLIQTTIGQPFKNDGKLKVYESLEYIQNILGESAVINVDLNVDCYGVEYSENVLGEWSETYEPRLGIFIRNDKFVHFDQEGSISIFHSLLNE
jgi:hypothetical protein